MAAKKNSKEEIKRLKALLSYGVMDTPREEEFDELAQLVAVICGTPMAIISFIDDKRQWYKAKVGIANDEVPVEETFCRFTLGYDRILEIPDATKDRRVKNNPHVTAKNGVRFYAGVPLKSDDGYSVGTVCAVGTKPKKLNTEQKKALNIIARHAMHLLDTRKKNRSLGGELKSVIDQRIAEAKRQLKLQHTAYNNLFQAISRSNGVVEFAPDATILSVNKIFSAIIGYSEKELVGKKHDSILDGEDRKKNKLFWKALREGKPQSGRFKRIHKNGDVVWIQASYSPVLGADGKVSRVTKVAQNITAEKEAQVATEKAKLLAEELSAQKDHFIANMSHEIRTPINAIIGFTELLLEEEEQTERRNKLQAINSAGDTLLYLVNDILDLSKLEAGILQIEKQPYDLKHIIENAFSILEVKAAQKKLRFDYTIAGNVPINVNGDRNRLTQILLNLLGNAIKFTHRGSVTLDVRQGKKGVQFAIADTGIGIPKDKLSSIFERFIQAGADTSRKYGGTGLGLNISRQLIEKFGGTIHVKSTLKKGSVFTFEIPLEETKQPVVYRQKSPVTANQKKRTGRILVCEDNALNQRLLQSIFASTDFVYDIAENGKQGVAFAKEKEYDLILMDIQMPEMNGFKATEVIRKKHKINTPIIALTAHSMVKEKKRCLDAGMNDYLSKPFRRSELLAKMDQWLSQQTSSSEKPAEKETPKKDYVSGRMNLAGLEELSGGDKEFQKEMLELFQSQTREAMEQLHAAAGASDYEQLKSVAHRLRSTVGMLQADTALIVTLEQDSKKKADIQTIRSTVDALSNHINALNQEVDHIIPGFA